MATPPEPVTDAKALLDAANRASEKVAALHIAFLAVCTYVVVIVFSTTDMDLLIGKGIKLPVVAVDVPLQSLTPTTAVIAEALRFRRRSPATRRHRRSARPVKHFSVQLLPGRPTNPASGVLCGPACHHHHIIVSAG